MVKVYPPFSKVYSILAYNFLKFGSPAVLIQTMKFSCSISYHWYSFFSLSGRFLNLLSMSDYHAIPVVVITTSSPSVFAREKVSLKRLLATRPHGKAGSSIFNGVTLSTETKRPMSLLSTIGEQSSVNSSSESRLPRSCLFERDLTYLRWFW